MKADRRYRGGIVLSVAVVCAFFATCSGVLTGGLPVREGTGYLYAYDATGTRVYFDQFDDSAEFAQSRDRYERDLRALWLSVKPKKLIVGVIWTRELLPDKLESNDLKACFEKIRGGFILAGPLVIERKSSGFSHAFHWNDEREIASNPNETVGSAPDDPVHSYMVHSILNDLQDNVVHLAEAEFVP